MALTRPKAAQINTVVTAISDPIAVLNNGSTIASSDIGFVLNRDSGTNSNVGLFWQESSKKLVAALTNSNGASNTIDILGYADVKFGNLSITGGIYADQVFNTNGTPLLDTITSEIATLTTNVANQAINITALQSASATQQNQITNLNAQIITANTAMQGYVDNQLTTLINGAPGALDTLKELADAFSGANDTVVTLSTMIGNVQANVIAETNARITSDTTLTDNLTQEILRATTAETALTSNINALTTAISTEANARIASDTALTSDIANLSSRIDYVISNTDTTAIDSLTELVGELDVFKTGLLGNIAAETAARIASDNILTTAIADEANARIASDATLTSDIANLANSISSEANARIASDATLTSSITDEANARIASDTALTSDIANLSSRIDYVISNTDPAALDSLTEIVTSFQLTEANLANSISSEINARTIADTALSGNINALTSAISNEVARATNAETALGNSISSEANARIASDTALTGNIATLTTAITDEVTRATDAEAELTGNIANLSSRIDYVISNIDPTALDSLTELVGELGAFKTSLLGNIAVETTRAVTAETALSTSIRAEANARIASDTALTSDIANLSSRIDYVISNTNPDALDSLTEIVGELDVFKTGLLGNIAAETAARIASDNILTSDIANLSSRIDYVITNTDPAALDSLTEVATEIQLVKSVNANLENRVAAIEAEESTRFARFEFLTASTTWVVVHNRNTLSYMEKITNIDNQRMYVMINTLDNNSFEVVLTEAMSGYVDVFFG